MKKSIFFVILLLACSQLFAAYHIDILTCEEYNGSENCVSCQNEYGSAMLDLKEATPEYDSYKKGFFCRDYKAIMGSNLVDKDSVALPTEEDCFKLLEEKCDKSAYLCQNFIYNNACFMRADGTFLCNCNPYVSGDSAEGSYSIDFESITEDDCINLMNSICGEEGPTVHKTCDTQEKWEYCSRRVREIGDKCRYKSNEEMDAALQEIYDGAWEEYGASQNIASCCELWDKPEIRDIEFTMDISQCIIDGCQGTLSEECCAPCLDMMVDDGIDDPESENPVANNETNTPKNNEPATDTTDTDTDNSNATPSDTTPTEEDSANEPSAKEEKKNSDGCSLLLI